MTSTHRRLFSTIAAVAAAGTISIATAGSAAATTPAEPADSPQPLAACTAAQVALSITDQEEGAGQRYAHLTFTAIGDATCTLDGYPENLAFLRGDGSPMQTTAWKEGMTPAPVTLAPGSPAEAELRWVAVPADDEDPNQPAPALLALYLPGATDMSTVAWTGGQTFQHGYIGVSAVHTPHAPH